MTFPVSSEVLEQMAKRDAWMDAQMARTKRLTIRRFIRRIIGKPILATGIDKPQRYTVTGVLHGRYRGRVVWTMHR